MRAGTARSIIVLGSVLLAGCGGGDSSEEDVVTAPGANQPAAAGKAPKCLVPEPAAVRALERTLDVPGRLAGAAGVRAPDVPQPSAFTQGGLYFISAGIDSPEVKPNTVGTWAVSGKFFKTGKGASAPADFVAGGFAGGSERAEAAGIDATTVGAPDSRVCQRKR